MSEITFSPEETETLVTILQTYFEEELDQELGQFDAQFLLEFITKNIGPHFYNKGLLDAEAVLSSRMDDLSEAISSLEKDIPRL